MIDDLHLDVIVFLYFKLLHLFLETGYIGSRFLILQTRMQFLLYETHAVKIGKSICWPKIIWMADSADRLVGEERFSAYD